jgi:hypothetical protein
MWVLELFRRIFSFSGTRPPQPKTGVKRQQKYSTSTELVRPYLEDELDSWNLGSRAFPGRETLENYAHYLWQAK